MSFKILKSIISALDLLLLAALGAISWLGSLIPSLKAFVGFYLTAELTFFLIEKLRHKKLNNAFVRPPDPG